MALVSLVASNVYGSWVTLEKNQKTPWTVQVLQSSPNATVVQFQLNGFEQTKVSTNLGAYNELSVPGLTTTDLAGAPQLPKHNFNLMVPFKSQPTVSVLQQDEVSFDVERVLPSRGTLYRCRKFGFKEPAFALGQAYSLNQPYPADRTSIVKPFIFRDLAGLNVSINPFHYNPVQKKLTVVKKIVLRIDHAGRTMLRANRPMNISFMKSYEKAFINFANQAGRSWKPENAPSDTGKLLVVAHAVFAEELKFYLNWKRKRGYAVEMITLGSNGTRRNVSATQIKELIAKYYVDQNVSNVLLVGDAEFVPFHPGTAGNVKDLEADPTYGMIDGNDSYPEVLISRISVKTPADLKRVLTKLYNYEVNPHVDGEWYSRATGIASDEGFPKDSERAEILKKTLLSAGFRSVDQIYDPGAQPTLVGEALNQGRGFVNYIGHGSETAWVTSRYAVNHIQELKNTTMNPFIVSVACVNGSFARYDSFAEQWLLGGREENTGAVAIYASSTNQSWVPPTVGQLKITELVAGGVTDTVGMLFMMGGIAVLEDASSTAEQTIQSWHVFGDGTLQIRTRPPLKFSVKPPTALKVVNGYVQIATRTPGATVSITSGDDFVGAAVSNGMGIARIPVKGVGAEAIPVEVTFTGFNMIPVSSGASLTN